MPRMCWTVLLGALLVWAQLAAGGEPLSPACDCPCQVKGRAEPAYALSPGCCEARRHCFDNAWDGYCAGKGALGHVLVQVGHRRVVSLHARRHLRRPRRGPGSSSPPGGGRLWMPGSCGHSCPCRAAVGDGQEQFVGRTLVRLGGLKSALRRNREVIVDPPTDFQIRFRFRPRHCR